MDKLVSQPPPYDILDQKLPQTSPYYNTKKSVDFLKKLTKPTSKGRTFFSIYLITINEFLTEQQENVKTYLFNIFKGYTLAKIGIENPKPGSRTDMSATKIAKAAILLFQKGDKGIIESYELSLAQHFYTGRYLKKEKEKITRKREEENSKRINLDKYVLYIFKMAASQRIPVSDVDLTKIYDFIEKNKQTAAKETANASLNDLFKELELEEQSSSVQKPTKKKKAKKGAKKKTKAKAKKFSFRKEEAKLCAPPSSPTFSIPILGKTGQWMIHPRVTRWNKCTIKKVRTFVDRPFAGQTPYSEMPNSELQTQIACHRLTGTLQLLSPDLIDRYSCFYNYQNPENGRKQSGRLFYAEMDFDKERTKGTITVGIDGNKIYHLHFRPFPDQIESGNDLVEPLVDIETDTEEGWEAAGDYTLDFEADNRVKLVSGDATFYIHPID